MAAYKVSDVENHFLLHRHPDTSLEVVMVETLLTLQENLFDLLLELGVPLSRWMFSVLDLLEQMLIRPFPTGKINFPFFFEKYYFL